MVPNYWEADSPLGTHGRLDGFRDHELSIVSEKRKLKP
jgi:hypothetical protein